jgi:hypothetical protein
VFSALCGLCYFSLGTKICHAALQPNNFVIQSWHISLKTPCFCILFKHLGLARALHYVLCKPTNPELKMQKYQVSKKHTAGILAGLITTEITTVKFAVGFVCKKAIGGGSYIVIECEAI